MFRAHTFQALVLLAASASSLTASGPARAKEDKRVCKAAYADYKAGSAALKAGHVHDAKLHLDACLKSGCAGVLHSCKATRAKLMAAMPTIVPVVTDQSGALRADAQVRVDGVLLASRLDGTGLSVEPGVHEFTFSLPNGQATTRKIMVIEGWRNAPFPVSISDAEGAEPAAQPSTLAPSSPEQQVPIESAPPPEPAPVKPLVSKPVPSEPPAREPPGPTRWALPSSPVPYAIAGVGVAGVVLGAIFTVRGHRDNRALENSCSPDCKTSSLDHVRHLYVAADVSFGVGIAALGVATWLFASSRTNEAPRAAAVTRVEAHPLPSGAFASISRSF